MMTMFRFTFKIEGADVLTEQPSSSSGTSIRFPKGGLPSSDGFVTEEVRGALRYLGGFPVFQEEGLSVTPAH
jgi:hypothetical protein